MPPAPQLRAAAAVLLCLGSVRLAEAVDWCQPRLLLTMPALQPCSNPSHCCSIWGICGAGEHYCKANHCAGGACLDVLPTALPPEPAPGSGGNPFALSPPPAAAPAPLGSVENPFELPSPPPPPPVGPENPFELSPGPEPATPTGESPPPSAAAAASPPPAVAASPPPPPTTGSGEGGNPFELLSPPPPPVASLSPPLPPPPPPPSPAPAPPPPPFVVGMPPPNPPGVYTYVALTEDQKRRMYQLTSVFENANTNLQYGFAKRLYDGRGITYGFCGFTTGTGDGLMVAEEFARLKPRNPLARFIPALKKLAGRGDRFTGLNGFEDEVRKLKSDADFIKAQWTVCDKEYNVPAMRWCQKIKCTQALTKAQLHDALVNHGEGRGDRFSVDYIFDAAEKKMRGTPATGIDEIAWLRAFLDARYKLLYSYGKNERASVKRIEIYRKLVDSGNYNLAGPIYIDLKKRTSKAGEPPVWQVLDAYYGSFLIYDTPPEGRRLDIIV